jgi:hypothetical protein
MRRKSTGPSSKKAAKSITHSRFQQNYKPISSVRKSASVGMHKNIQKKPKVGLHTGKKRKKLSVSMH